MVFLTVQNNGMDRNSYFAGLDQRTGSARKNCGGAILSFFSFRSLFFIIGGLLGVVRNNLVVILQ